MWGRHGLTADFTHHPFCQDEVRMNIRPKLRQQTIPEMSLMVDGVRWDVFILGKKQMSEMAGSDATILGLTDYENLRLFVCQTCIRRVAKQTLFHELGHAFLAAWGVVDNPSQVPEELAVELLSGIGSLAMAEHKKIERFLKLFPESRTFIRESC
jgi:hypothetical protein